MAVPRMTWGSKACLGANSTHACIWPLLLGRPVLRSSGTTLAHGAERATVFGTLPVQGLDRRGA